MNRTNDLTQGGILHALWIMAVPLITSSFVQMAYSMTDMLWLGHLGSNYVAAVGAAGFFTWLCNALSMMTKVGAEITVAQSLGAKDRKRAAVYANHAITLSTLVGLVYAIFIFIFASRLISFFHFEESIAEMSVNYLRIVSPGIFLTFNNNTFSGLYNGQGNSTTPFRITVVGLIVNIVLDPLLIYGYGPFPHLGTAGAAIATAMSQLIVYLIFVKRIFTSDFPLGKMHLFIRLKAEYVKRIIRLGLPISLESALFSVFSFTLATLAARWGHIGVAVQSIGAQIEAISWMSAAGFSTALAAFTGQNYGAGNFERIRKGFFYTLGIAGCIGLAAGVLFLIFSREIFGIFVNDPATIEEGGKYMRILAISQLFIVTEMVTAGAFNGCGKTIPPAIIGIVLTGARIPLAYFLCSLPAFGLDGIWWSITISTIFKGALLPLWFLGIQGKLKQQLRPGISI